MKRITKESLATVFQISVIIFLFSYSFPSSESGENYNAPVNLQGATIDSLNASRQMNKKAGGRKIIIDYYRAKKNTGRLYTQLTLEPTFKDILNSIPDENESKNNNWLSSTIHPAVFRVK